MSASPFDAYSAYYDLLYAEKDYSGEARFVSDSLQRWCPDAHTILEMGCGTGAHARELIELGYDVTGFDVSETMLGFARSVEGFICSKGDVRTYRDGTTYDAVSALFHVMSYLTTDEDLSAGFTTAAAHLESGGMFAFDVWYGPAVLAQKPERRERVIENERFRIVRVATPTHEVDEHRVDVRYDIEVTDRATETMERFSETHPMRYLFADDVARLLDEAGFDLVESCGFGTGAPLSEATWGAWFVGRKR